VSVRLRRRLASVLALTSVAVVGGVVHANAPAGQYASFDRNATCISDLWTKLTWVRTPTPSPGTFSDAAKQCAALDADGGAPLWRVPSVNELETLVDDVPHDEPLGNGQFESKAIDANAFPLTDVTHSYWTSSIVPQSTSAWVVDFRQGGTAKQEQSLPLSYVRCVSSWMPGAPVAGVSEPATCAAAP
jgi:hypothetical protein